MKVIRKHTKSKSALSNCIDGITGEADIADMWGRHYEQLLNDSSNETSKITVLNSFCNMLAHVGMQMTMRGVLVIVNDLPNEFEGLNSESVKHAEPFVCLLLSICFTCMFTHCCMSPSMIKSIIVSLVKNKCGNMADKNNYKLIALSSISVKVFEHVILFCLEDYIWHGIV